VTGGNAGEGGFDQKKRKGGGGEQARLQLWRRGEKKKKVLQILLVSLKRLTKREKKADLFPSYVREGGGGKEPFTGGCDTKMTLWEKRGEINTNLVLRGGKKRIDCKMRTRREKFGDGKEEKKGTRRAVSDMSTIKGKKDGGGTPRRSRWRMARGGEEKGTPA